MKKEIKYFFKTKWNFISLIYSKVIIFFGYKYDESVIPSGPYCYSPDDEKNNRRGNGSKWVYYIKPCPYYKPISKYYNGCKYYGIITDDIVFNDQCKLCSINDNVEDYECGNED